jgi:hypothetical protein
MKARLNTLMGQTQQELNAFGDATLFGDKHQVRAPFLSLYYWSNIDHRKARSYFAS